ncbi:MAG TPA: amidohydrolase family protein [Terriglobales bacterium]|nr:amidohydrolase family protein [Terriglobales bacterium]
MGDILFDNLRLTDGRSGAILCAEGRIAAIGPGDQMTRPADCPVVDAGGRLLLPALVESHIHLDKTFWGGNWQPATGGPLLINYITNERRLMQAAAPVAQRGAALLEHCIALGSLRMRSHIDVDAGIGLSHVEALLDLRQRYRHLVDLDFVAFPQQGVLISPGTIELMEQAIGMGVETIGGLDPAGIDHDPVGQLRLIFDLATKHGCSIDIHLHDPGELGIWQIARIADFTAATGLAGKVMISHAYSLGTVPTGQIEGLARRLADLDISLMTTGPADSPLPPVGFLREIGVNVCSGSDNIRDAWSPFGTGDMLERALFLALRMDWSKDADIARAFDCVTTKAAHALRLPQGAASGGYGLDSGCRADFLLVQAETLGDAIARRPRDRIVIRDGAVIAENGRLLPAIA